MLLRQRLFTAAVSLLPAASITEGLLGRLPPAAAGCFSPFSTHTASASASATSGPLRPVPPIDGVNAVIAVASGKGGVGKSTTAGAGPGGEPSPISKGRPRGSFRKAETVPATTSLSSVRSVYDALSYRSPAH